MRVGIALGSNLGDRLAHLREARARIGNLPMVQGPILASAVYETVPVGCEPGANSFLNAIIEVEASPEKTCGSMSLRRDVLPHVLGETPLLRLLRALREIETDLGRSPSHLRNTSRTLDLDLLYFGQVEIDTPELELPHPRMLERRFVLEPLADIRPDLVLPSQTKNVATLLRQLPDDAPLVRVTSQW